jgi:hypothetical protein
LIESRSAFERRVLSALEEPPRRIPLLLGQCGSGRTTVLRSLQRQLGPRACHYVNVERSATTPERFFRAVVSTSPFRMSDARAANTPREAFEAILASLTLSRAENGRPAVFLLDEVLEFRTFESFPGLRHVLDDMFSALASSENRFVLASRYTSRAERLTAKRDTFAPIRVPPLGEAEIREMLASSPNGRPASPDTILSSFGDAARIVQALSDGRPSYVREIRDQMAALGRDGGADPISALTALLSPGGRLSERCGYSYELRLHRARGYGALKAILEVLAADTGLTLTEIAQRLHRTPGSTKDYLSWLEDVDLIVMNRKRYAFADPLLRLWVKLHCRPVPPQEEEVAREVQRYALERLAQVMPHAAV